jgi:hypothetical protein
LPVDPRDLDLLADDVAAAELIYELRGAVVSDEAYWDRGDVRAVRRVLAVVHGVEVEILEGVEAVGPTGGVVVATPDLDRVDRIFVSGRRIPVLPLSTMHILLDATGKRERAAMVAKVLGRGQYQGSADLHARHQSGMRRELAGRQPVRRIPGHIASSASLRGAEAGRRLATG